MTFSTDLVRNPARANKLLGEFPDGSAPEQSKELNSFVLDDFENYAGTEFPVMKDNSEGTYRFWHQDPTDTSGDERPGEATITTNKPLFGTKSAEITVTNGTARGGVGNGSQTGDAGALMFRMYNNLYTGVNDYRTLDEINPGTGYQQNTYNRMRIWVWLPPETVAATTTSSEAASAFYAPNEGLPDGSANFHIGTYHRRPEEDKDVETDNFKFYQYYNLLYMNNWVAIEVDTYPDHIRSGPDQDLGDYHYPMLRVDEYTGSLAETENYFDTMTWFYINDKFGVNNYPATWWVDGIELYTVDYANEDVQNVKSVAAARSNIPASPNRIWVQWHRNEDLGKTDTLYDLKYSYTSFYDAGSFENHGVIAPNQINDISSQGVFGYNSGGHNCIHYQTDLIPLTGKTVLYVAIRMQGETDKFRQVRIPLTSAGLPEIGS